MKNSIRHRRTYSLAVFCALTSVFLILNGCGDDDDGGGVPLKVTYSISGQVMLTGSGLAGVTMALSGASSATTTTDNVGNYTFTGLDNGSYTITPSKTGFTFSPADNTQTVSGADINAVNFIATPVQAVTYSISGQATWNGSGLVGVRMDLNGVTLASVTTDNVGNYTFTNLNNGTYTVTPNKPDVTFSPTSSTQTVSGANITAVNFAATPTKAGPFIIFGSVSSAGSGLIGVTMTLSGASSATTTTDIYGTFEFTGLANGSYTITPSKTGFTFSPADNTQTVSGTDLTGVRFIATPVQAGTHSISGQATSTGSGLSAVTMTLSGASSATAITDASGNYTFTNLANGSYTVTPSRTGFTFNPTSSVQTMGGADITSVNFIATQELIAQIVPCPPSGTKNVTIQDFSFTPDNVTINANGIVKWTNNGTTHTVTSVNIWDYSADIFDSGELGTGETFCVQFQGNGTSQYACSIHPAMFGSVVVQ